MVVSSAKTAELMLTDALSSDVFLSQDEHTVGIVGSSSVLGLSSRLSEEASGGVCNVAIASSRQISVSEAVVKQLE
jgi:hypothetical protein